MELASSLAKNATKANAFEIMPLETTRKEDNWKIEEALARAAVTLEKERVKGVHSLTFMIMMMIVVIPYPPFSTMTSSRYPVPSTVIKL